MSEITTYRGTVYPWHCDQMGHMNVMWYVGKFDEAAWNLLLDIGFPPSYLRAQNRGFGVVNMAVEYNQELYAGDALEIRSAVTGVGAKVIAVRQTMVRSEDKTTVARWEATAVHLDTQSRKAVALPEAAVSLIHSHFPGVIALPSRTQPSARAA